MSNGPLKFDADFPAAEGQASLVSCVAASRAAEGVDNDAMAVRVAAQGRCPTPWSAVSRR